MTEEGREREIEAVAIAEPFVPMPRPTVASVELDGEVVVLDEERAILHRLNPTASLLWQVFDRSSTVGDLAADVADVFGISPDQAKDDVIALVQNLGELGLLEGVRYEPAVETESPASASVSEVTTPRYLEEPPSN